MVTDHKSLAALKDLLQDCGRRGRRSDKLDHFSTAVRYHPSEETHVDGLTRHSTVPGDVANSDPVLAPWRFLEASANRNGSGSECWLASNRCRGSRSANPPLGDGFPLSVTSTRRNMVRRQCRLPRECGTGGDAGDRGIAGALVSLLYEHGRIFVVCDTALSSGRDFFLIGIDRSFFETAPPQEGDFV